MITLRSIVLVIATFAAGGCREADQPFVLATTTSVANSGLLDAVLPAYQTPVRVLQVGSGRALALLSAGEADVAITHAPEQEAQGLRSHPAWFYRKILYNDFLIVGPPADPAGIAGMSDAAHAMRRIRESHQRFISRGDESGTHERERQLWVIAGSPPSSQVVVAGASMAQTLKIASETNSYTLTDRGTFETLSGSLQLRELVNGDVRLLNTYAVIADPSDEAGLQFARWLAEGEGRHQLAAVLNSGKVKGFLVWPADHDGTSPSARPFSK